jgi:hypothetical protein
MQAVYSQFAGGWSPGDAIQFSAFAYDRYCFAFTIKASRSGPGFIASACLE